MLRLLDGGVEDKHEDAKNHLQSHEQLQPDVTTFRAEHSLCLLTSSQRPEMVLVGLRANNIVVAQPDLSDDRLALTLEATSRMQYQTTCIAVTVGACH